MNKKIILVMISLGWGGLVWGSDFGSAAVKEGHAYTLEEMLLYALEDEHMALAEYNALMDAFSLTRPYSNIVQSEETHISYLETLYRNYGIQIPVINTDGLIQLPASPLEAAEAGVEAEINNIAMYDVFLKQELPKDVYDTFVFLRKASENHLRAFQNQVSLPSGRGGRNS